ncbi:hypothetical protein [Neobacillus drentensis]|uniref:hypothetical protein n=1 Tax=Neobacillus drentensis TaxID=220684 RepID=UPI002FFE96CC
MLTLKNIGLNDEDIVVIDFNFEGKKVNFSGQITLSKEKFVNCHKNGDTYLHSYVETTLQQELIHWVNL